jgi:hypothetical protein
MLVQPEIEFGTDFIEETVFFTVHELERQGKQMELVERFHQDRSRLYEVADETNQNQFAKFYLDFFRELGLRQFFYDLTIDFPRLAKESVRLLIRRSYGRKSEGAELFVRGSVRTVITALQTTRILDLNFLSGYLRHEWTRISDMLDPAFEYDAHASLRGTNEIEENLNRDRFKILWDLSIASRLLNEGHFSFMNIEELKNRFEIVFSAWFLEERDAVYETVTRSWPISQKAMIDFSVAGDHKRISELAPIRCPLCHFTSYQLLRNWEDDRVSICSMAQEDYPEWSPEDGMCVQCFELFRSRQKVGHKP